MVGFGYVPLRSPPAAPFGGNDVGITPAANFAAVTEASAIFSVVTLLSASLVAVIALAATVGFGYVPDRSPPAAPSGGNEVGMTPAASLARVTEPSKILLVVIALIPMVGLGYVPLRRSEERRVGKE